MMRRLLVTHRRAVPGVALVASIPLLVVDDRI
jgi:hypothetical protein